jgi:hypothetical protein
MTLSSVSAVVADAATSMPCWENSAMTVSSTNTDAACVMRMPSMPVRVPIVPDAPGPLIVSPPQAHRAKRVVRATGM